MMLMQIGTPVSSFGHEPNKRSITLVQDTEKASQDARQEDQVGSGSVVTPHGAVEVNASPMSMV